MNYKAAQELIYSLTGHVSRLVFSYTREDGTIEGQLTTGNSLAPIVAIRSSLVCESDLIEALETEMESVSILMPCMSLSDLDMWGYSIAPQVPIINAA